MAMQATGVPPTGLPAAAWCGRPPSSNSTDWTPLPAGSIGAVEMRGEPPIGTRREGGGIRPVNSAEGGGPYGVALREQDVEHKNDPTLDDPREALVAANAHRPQGGRWLNVGVQDAVHLGWNFAQAIKGHHPAACSAPTTTSAIRSGRACCTTRGRRSPARHPITTTEPRTRRRPNCSSWTSRARAPTARAADCPTSTSISTRRRARLGSTNCSMARRPSCSTSASRTPPRSTAGPAASAAVLIHPEDELGTLFVAGAALCVTGSTSTCVGSSTTSESRARTERDVAMTDASVVSS